MKKTTPKAERLPSGSYRVRKMIKGKQYTLIFDHEPDAEEITVCLAHEIKKAGVQAARLSFADASRLYVESIDGVLSISTVRDYAQKHNYIKKHYRAFSALSVRDITQADVQSFINQYAKKGDANPYHRTAPEVSDIKPRSPKSVRNMHAFIASVLSVYAPSLTLHTVLPPLKKASPYIPTDSDVKAVLDASKGTEYEIAFELLCYGLRRSELCALTIDDLTDDNRLWIHRAKVPGAESTWEIQDRTKTPESTRYIEISPALADKIRSAGYIYRGSPASIGKTLQRIQDRLGIERFSPHKFRHWFCSSMHAQNVPAAYIQAAGGWKTDYMMNAVYRHALDGERREMDKRHIDHLEKILS